MLADALAPLMAAAPEEREVIGKKARDVLVSKYGNNIVYDQWECLLKDVHKKSLEDGETALGRIMRMNEGVGCTRSGEDGLAIGKDWEGLGPGGVIWTGGLLEAAGAEIAGRGDPGAPLESSGAGYETENARLRSELARVRHDFGRLEKKYLTLMGRFQALSAQKGRGGARRR